jgi:Kef-type K+ transport system membrane component KefB
MSPLRTDDFETVTAIVAPHGAVLDFTLLFAVILLGPVVVKYARVPGLIGLLLGGFAIGSHGLGWIEAGNQTLPELGQLGLLYLMFVAGLELDLRILGQYRRAAVSFGLITFAVPFSGGLAVGFALGWDVWATLLLGSLLASHTLILYPMAREARLGTNPAVASAVGATVLTDTLALVVLAVVAGTQTGTGSAGGVLLEIGIGLVVLVIASLVVLPRIAAAALRLWGGDRAARLLVAIVGFLLMAMLAEVFGIEGIVGAFFAGLGLNRLVPNHGPSMERIEFFGSAVIIPMFLVSVGLLLDPSVMFTPETLGLAGLICVGCLGGKAIAALLARPVLGFNGPEAGAMFVLTTPQAAATLAATLIGFEIGLFSTSVVNAVLVLILVSIVVTTVLAPRFLKRIPVPTREERALGEHVLLVTPPTGPSRAAVRVAELLAKPDGGVIDVVVAHEYGEEMDEPSLRAREEHIFRGTMDGEVRAMAGSTVVEAVTHAMLGAEPSLIIVDGGHAEDVLGRLRHEAARTAAPVVALNGHSTDLLTGTAHDDKLREEIVRRLE